MANEEQTGKEYKGLVFRANPKLKHKAKKKLNILVAKSFQQKEGEEVQKSEGGNVFDKLNFKEVPDLLEVQIEAKELLNEELVKIHWNTQKYWETAGQQDNHWDKNSIDDVDGDDYDNILLPPVEEENLLKLKKN